MQMFPIVNGIFYHINYQFPQVLTITTEELDLNFLTLYGLKTCAPVVHVVHQNQAVSQLTQAELQKLADLILSMYKWKWDRLASILDIEYDPIHNYSDTYHEELSEGIDAESTRTPDITLSNNESLTIDTLVTDGGSEREVREKNDSATRTDNLSESVLRDDDLSESNTRTLNTTKTSTRTDNLSEVSQLTGEDNLYGFNSEEAVGADTNASNTTRTNTGTVMNIEKDTGTISDRKSNSGTQEVTRTNTGTVDNSTESSDELTRYGGLTHSTDDSHVTQGTKRTTGTETNESSSDRNRVRDFTHLGNIGNLTTQQLITQEIELWRWNFIQQVLNDVKDFLTLPVYD